MGHIKLKHTILDCRMSEGYGPLNRTGRQEGYVIVDLNLGNKSFEKQIMQYYEIDYSDDVKPPYQRISFIDEKDLSACIKSYQVSSETDINGEISYRDEQDEIHRANDLPAIIQEQEGVQFYIKGKLHRTFGPATECNFGFGDEIEWRWLGNKVRDVP